MISPKCPVAGCQSTGFQIVPSKDKAINLLVCDSGHVISRDYGSELVKMIDEISSGLFKSVTSHAEAFKKEIKEAVCAKSKKD
jgi:hypothetical protein